MILRVTKILALPAAVLALGGLGGVAGVACAPAEPAKGQPAAAFPPWEGHSREVFDDNIDPAAVGLSLDGPSPRADSHLRERAQTADVVARVRVQTVTVGSSGEVQTYHLGIQVVAPPLTEPRVPDRSFELSIKSASGAFRIARSFDDRLRGLGLVGFVKRFN